MNLKGSALERRQTALSAMMDEAIAAGDSLELQFE
jgi:hypothetical protein